MINFEGGAIPEEYRDAYVVDRVNTTGTVWLGLTRRLCAVPRPQVRSDLAEGVSTSSIAFFNNVPENGLDGSQGQRRAAAQGPHAETAATTRRTRCRRSPRQTRKLNAPDAELEAAQAAWEKTSNAEREASSVDAVRTG